MKIAILGAGGFIGQAVYRQLIANNQIIILSRRELAIGKSDRFLFVRYSSYADLTDAIIRIQPDAIINLSGEPVAAKRWTKKQKEKIISSRILTSRAVTEALKAINKSTVLINASAIGFYGDTGETAVDETCSHAADFLSNVCFEWEKEALSADSPGKRVVCIRLGVVLGNGGALKKMIPAFRMFLGGPLGNGRQWMSWIHIDDVSRLIETVLVNDVFRGPVNAVSPNPVRMSDFVKTLGGVLSRPTFFRVPLLILKLILGERASVITTSQKVIPQKLKNAGFAFKFETLETALKDLLIKNVT